MNQEVLGERRRRGEGVDGDCRGGRGEGERERALRISAYFKDIILKRSKSRAIFVILWKLATYPGGRVRVEAAGGGGAVAELERAEAHLLGGVAVAVGLALAVEHLVFGRAAPAYHSGLCKGWKAVSHRLCHSLPISI